MVSGISNEADGCCVTTPADFVKVSLRSMRSSWRGSRGV